MEMSKESCFDPGSESELFSTVGSIKGTCEFVYFNHPSCPIISLTVSSFFKLASLLSMTYDFVFQVQLFNLISQVQLFNLVSQVQLCFSSPAFLFLLSLSYPLSILPLKLNHTSWLSLETMNTSFIKTFAWKSQWDENTQRKKSRCFMAKEIVIWTSLWAPILDGWTHRLGCLLLWWRYQLADLHS